MNTISENQDQIIDNKIILSSRLEEAMNNLENSRNNNIKDLKEMVDDPELFLKHLKIKLLNLLLYLII